MRRGNNKGVRVLHLAVLWSICLGFRRLFLFLSCLLSLLYEAQHKEDCFPFVQPENCPLGSLRIKGVTDSITPECFSWHFYVFIEK